jgi:hypothetical protein
VEVEARPGRLGWEADIHNARPVEAIRGEIVVRFLLPISAGSVRLRALGENENPSRTEFGGAIHRHNSTMVASFDS